MLIHLSNTGIWFNWWTLIWQLVALEGEYPSFRFWRWFVFLIVNYDLNIGTDPLIVYLHQSIIRYTYAIQISLLTNSFSFFFLHFYCSLKNLFYHKLEQKKRTKDTAINAFHAKGSQPMRVLYLFCQSVR